MCDIEDAFRPPGAADESVVAFGLSVIRYYNSRVFTKRKGAVDHVSVRYGDVQIKLDLEGPFDEMAVLDKMI